MQPFDFLVPPLVRFGPGVASILTPGVARTLGARVLLVTDGVLRRLGLVDPFLSALRETGATVTVFDEVLPEPPDSTVHDAVALAASIAATGVVGFGGGSAMDVAKLTALIAGGGETLERIYGVGVATGPRLPLVLVPSTAGTGSEATPVAILTAGGVKKGVVSPHLLPDIAVLDPILTLGLPASVTAATGMDAMIHAIEAFTSASPSRNPISQGLARQALRLLGANLRRVVENGADREARGAMLLGSFMAGQAFGNAPVAAVHALAYPVGGRFHIPHGVSTALMLAPVMRFNLPDAADAYAEIAPDVFPALAVLPVPDRASVLIDQLAALAGAIGLPPTLAAIGVSAADLPGMAADAMLQTRLLVNNPRPVSEKDALAIYRNAFG